MTTDKTQDAPITHTLAITMGGATLLKELLPLSQWYKDEAPDTGMIAVEVTEMLSAIESSTGSDADAPYDLVLDEEQRDACKACIRFFYKVGGVLLTTHLRTLMRQLGLTKR